MPSPSVVEKDMNWPEAMQAVIDGKKITRKEWANNEVRVYLTAGMLHLRKADGTLHHLLTADADMLASDWVVVREH